MTDFSFPVVITTAGVQPTAPSDINAQIIANAAALAPGYTVLPAALIEDISSTDTAACVLIDTARVESLNSLTPYGANAWLLAQLGAQAGIPLGLPNNTSVNVVFTGTIGYVISPGFLVGDGTNSYQIVDGTVIGSGGSSPATTAVAVNSGAFAVPANTVTQLLTSVPVAITLTVTNPVAGTPATSTETEQSYRGRTIQAGIASAQGMPSFLKTLVQNVPGVVPRLVRVIATLGSGLEVIVGGGDTVEVAGAIYAAVFNPAALLGSSAHPSANVTVSITDYPDVYQIIFVDPPAQVVTLALTWNTSLSNFTQAQAVASIAAQPLTDYINSIPVGLPINMLELNDTFVTAVASILDENTISKMSWIVTIAGTPVSAVGTFYSGDPESYLTAVITAVTITQG